MAENSDSGTGQASGETELREISDIELQDILDKHQLSVQSEQKEGERADLRKVDLSKNRQKEYAVDRYSGLSMKKPDFVGVVLRKGFLANAKLEEADLTGANFEGAVLTSANLKKVFAYNTWGMGSRLTGRHLVSRSAWMRDRRDERLTRPRPPGMHGPTQGVFLTDGHTQGPHCEPGIQAVPVSQEEALLGKPLLGQGLLRRHGGPRCGDDPQIR